MLASWKESYDKRRQHIEKQGHYFANKGPYTQMDGFSSNHVWMWELDHKEGWVPKNWWLQTVVLEKTIESPLDSKEIEPVNLKGNLPWLFIGRTSAKALKLWPPDVKSWLIGKEPDAGKDWGQEEKGMTKDEMAGWHHQLNGHEFGWTPGVGDGQGGLVCCDSWGRRVGNDCVTELNWSLPSDIPTYWPISQENHLSSSHMHPNVHFSTS